MDRSNKDASFTAGAATMVGLRLFEPLLQYRLLTDGSAAKLLELLRIPGLNPAVARFSTIAVRNAPGLSRFSLGGLNEVASVVVGMYSVAAIRHVYWAAFTRPYHFPVKAGAGVGIYNGLINLLFNTLPMVYLASRDPLDYQQLGWKQYAGLAIFLLGIGLEVVPEQTRKSFKSKPENKGRLDDTGAWGYLRNVNYLGYTLWRTGVSLAAGSLTATALTVATQLGMFIGFSIPQFDEDMGSRYREKWAEYKKKVPYAIIPGVY